jgi:tetratricopeptide (TPR) repeat protein
VKTFQRFVVDIIIIMILLAGCGSPPKRLIRYPTTPVPTELIATLEASITKITPQPYPTKYLLSQDVKDLVDVANGDFDAASAVQRLDEAIKKNMPGIQNPSVYMTLGTRYEDLGDTKKAIECYTKAIELYDDEAYTHLFRGELYYQQGDYEHASQDIQKALSIEAPGNLDTYNENEAYGVLLDIQNHH